MLLQRRFLNKLNFSLKDVVVLSVNPVEEYGMHESGVNYTTHKSRTAEQIQLKIGGEVA